ncbi:MAG TPA: phosphoribosyl-ATP diphosphatase [Candidatus Saccharimonadales bacterium]|nr:phosphoribosyl-ATP diphosphatase [Candidatus Saccharimonadales bacterium]
MSGEFLPDNSFEAYLTSVDVIYDKVVAVRTGTQEAESYTEILGADDNNICKKVGSEEAEFQRELFRPDFDADRCTGEAADLVYAVTVALASRGISMRAVFAVLALRNKPKL